jgi:hypothetical protein
MKYVPILLLVLSSACATGYHSRGFTGGYTDFQTGQDTYSVSYKVNGYSDPESAMVFARRRASELAIAAHRRCYTVVGGNCGYGAGVAVFHMGASTVAKPTSSTCSIDIAVTDDCDKPNTVHAQAQED